MALGAILCLMTLGWLRAQDPLKQIHEDFSTDPGWEGWQNRVVGEKNPTITQDFGWSPTKHASKQPGEIGGRIFMSTTPASYGLPFGKPLSFNDRFSASGSISIPPGEHQGAYFGFYNSTRQGWRPWNSMALRLTNIGVRGKPVMRVHIDFKTGVGGGSGLDTDAFVPTDGSRHTWKLSYDPDARPNMTWPDPNMPKYLTHQYEPVEQILPRALQFDPAMTAERLKKLLNQARDQGIAGHWFRKGIDTYWINSEASQMRGQVSFQLDDGPVYQRFLEPPFADELVVMDRFGIFNYQLYHGTMEFYLGDLVVNGQPIDLTRDPHWDGRGNRVTFIEPDFHERMNFGFSETNWAGEKIGEIGGRFYNTEPPDPMHGFYADDRVGKLTLDDPLSMSGTFAFIEGAPDAGLFIGWFNAHEKQADMSQTSEELGNPIPQSIGVEFYDSTRYGYFFNSICAPTVKLATHTEGPVLRPDRKRRQFKFDYDPKANNGVGRFTVQFDGQTQTRDLTPEQRKAGATMDHFGIMNIRRGGKYVDVYFDDLTYTARPLTDGAPVKHKQGVVKYEYPPKGRRF
jgi:hypothetical protein